MSGNYTQSLLCNALPVRAIAAAAVGRHAASVFVQEGADPRAPVRGQSRESVAHSMPVGNNKPHTRVLNVKIWILKHTIQNKCCYFG